jgi:hypothetical protein
VNRVSRDKRERVGRIAAEGARDRGTTRGTSRAYAQEHIRAAAQQEANDIPAKSAVALEQDDTLRVVQFMVEAGMIHDVTNHPLRPGLRLLWTLPRASVLTT